MIEENFGHNTRKKLLGLSTEEITAHDDKMRLLLASMMDQCYFSSDIDTAEEAVASFANAHSVFHDYVSNFKDTAILYLIESGEFEQAQAAVTLMKSLDELHLAVEWFELTIVDNLQRVKTLSKKSGDL